MIRVYRLPERLTDGFCFAGGKPITFLNVDWFDIPASMEVSREQIIENVVGKNYYDPAARYLVLDDREGETFVMPTAQRGDHEEPHAGNSGRPA